jgi:hypothetical protein
MSMEMPAKRQSEPDIAPEFYSVSRVAGKQIPQEWIIKGTDGKLYSVPGEPGG